MKREIKFKGKDIATGKWIYGSLCQSEVSKPTIVEPGMYEDTFVYRHTEVHTASVSQYTGLQDKKGNDIYEGDILESKSYMSRWVVIWKAGSFMLQSLGTTVDSFAPLRSDCKNLTVTGHIADDLHADDDPFKLTHLYTGAQTAF